jgi:hypothetical protein
MNDLKKFQEEQEELNKLRTNDYKKLRLIMDEYCGFTNLVTRKESNYINLWAINSFIEDFESKVIQSVGERKISATRHLETLYAIQCQYGKYHFESIIYREKVRELETNQIKFLEMIKELQKENELLVKQNKF